MRKAIAFIFSIHFLIIKKTNQLTSVFQLLLIGIFAFLSNSCEKPVILPAVITEITVSEITATTAKSGGTVTDDRGLEIIERGVCWSTTINPIVSNNKTEDGAGIGSYVSLITNLSPGTKYYVRAYAKNEIGITYGNNESFTTEIVLPTVSTNSVSAVGLTMATAIGNVLNDGGGVVTDRGVCWGVDDNPTIENNKKGSGNGNGIFTSKITNLISNSTYYLRAYATNSAGTAYGNSIKFSTLLSGTVTDIDGNVYKTVTYGNQTWMVENLRTTRYSNGVLINTSNPLSEGQWAYQNIESNALTYGRLYNYMSIRNNNKLAPDGWRIPSKTDWETLINYLKRNGFSSSTRLDFLISKSLATNTYWDTSTVGGSVGSVQSDNNASGFSAVPGGWRLNSGSYIGLGVFGWWWTTTDYSVTDDYFFEMRYDGTYPKFINITRTNGFFSVRCVKD